jgi:hypothetical protein
MAMLKKKFDQEETIMTYHDLHKLSMRFGEPIGSKKLQKRIERLQKIEGKQRPKVIPTNTTMKA